MSAERPAAVSISAMSLEDLSWAFDLGERLFTAERFTNLYRTWEEYELLSSYLSDEDYCLVARVRKKPVGFALGTTIEKRGSRWKYGHMLWLAVEPEYGGQGIATRLVDRLTELFIEDGIDIMMVDTEMSNTGAVKFFKKMGFAEQEAHVYLFRNIKPKKPSAGTDPGRRR
jgi:ribosomal protein S18 acetylase RimI-like enzyme